MIVSDTNILSTFARIQRLELLFAAVAADSLHLPPAVQADTVLKTKSDK